MFSLHPDYDKNYCPSEGYHKIYNLIQNFESEIQISILVEPEKMFLIFWGGGGWRWN
jgi:hypothetical protein